MAPGAEAPMHRTETVGVVREGETWLLLDDGSETRAAALGCLLIAPSFQVH